MSDVAPTDRRIFISYASQDAATATRIREGLEHGGLSCWIAPRDIDPGTSYPAAITAAATSCGALVLLLTEASNQSPHVLSEIELAFNARRPILAVLVGQVTPSPNVQYFISTTHWFDAESSFDDADLVRLREDLQKLLAGERLRIERDSGRRRMRLAAMAAAAVILVTIAVVALLRGRTTPGSSVAGISAPAPQSPGATPTPSTPEAAPGTTDTSPRTGVVERATPSGPALKTKTNPLDGQVYVWIPPGRFSMGCSSGDGDCAPDEKPTHRAVIRSGFWLARTEVTIAQYVKQGYALGSNKGKAPSLPVADVTRTEAKAYCAKVGGRLPTEAEWEYAARGGTTERYYDTLSEIAWYDENSDEHSHPVGLKSPNAFGLYDMLGNVYEWVLDRYYNKYDDADAAVEEPLAPNASGVVRGGSWASGRLDLRVTNRLDPPPDTSDVVIGFRCAMSGP